MRVGWFWESVIVQQGKSLVIVTANTATSAFICTIVAMQGAALGTLYMVMYAVRKLPSTPTSRARKGGVWRWMPMVRAPRADTDTAGPKT